MEIAAATSLIPPLVSLVADYLVGHVFVGSCVDVRDQLGLWVFGKIITIEGMSEQEELKTIEKVKCPMCSCLCPEPAKKVASINHLACSVCNFDLTDAWKVKKSEVQSSAEALDSATPTSDCVSSPPPSSASVSSASMTPQPSRRKNARCHIMFFGWPEKFNE